MNDRPAAGRIRLLQRLYLRGRGPWSTATRRSIRPRRTIEKQEKDSVALVRSNVAKHGTGDDEVEICARRLEQPHRERSCEIHTMSPHSSASCTASTCRLAPRELTRLFFRLLECSQVCTEIPGVGN